MKEEQQVSLKESERNTDAEVIQRLLSLAFENGYSFAAWRLPNDVEKKVLLSFTSTPHSISTPIENLESGFLFCPFNRDKAGHYLKADFIFGFQEGKLRNPESPLEINSQAWLQNRSEPKSNHQYYLHQQSEEYKPETQQDFLQLVQQCVHHIEQGNFEKIVPSRFKVVPVPDNFNPVASFHKLCESYPNALVSLVSLPTAGTWLGASPEILVSVENRSVFKTIALAGTQPYPIGANLKQVAWTQKEIEEQALVSRYIINCFKKIRLREFEEHGPKTVVAGNLMHLKTDFSVDMLATNFPQLGSVMLQLLHPTSAVCGMPLEVATEFLKANEGYDREFYSGYLGPVNIENDIHLFVNLRCMQITRQHVLLYAGSGVTIDSVPEKEWEETEMKMNTLGNVIG